MKTEGCRLHLAIPSLLAPTTEASKCTPVTLSTATKPSLALVMWQEGLCSYSVMGKEIWVMLRVEVLQTGNIYLPKVQILSFSVGDNHTKKETTDIMNNIGHFRKI